MDITAITGRILINNDGGLKSKGYPVGATAIAMVNEIWEQLIEEVEERQIKNESITGLTCNVERSYVSSMVFIFKREEK